MPSEIEELQELLRDFARERDWEQFHTPKNLAMALAAEAGELLQIFQWLTAEESSSLMESSASSDAESEIADVAIYLLLLSDSLKVSVADAVRSKMERNAHRFPRTH